ncbi:MAG: TFIIB-type zinc ribbon-containing protein [Candidatus Bathyarchaeia archaeon]
MSEQTVTHAKCPECGSTNLVRDIEMGEYICSNCGLVIRETILNRGAEWRASPQMKESPKQEQEPQPNILALPKVYPQPSELTEMLSAAPCQQRLDVRCGASEDGRFDQEFTPLKAETLRWL